MLNKISNFIQEQTSLLINNKNNVKHHYAFFLYPNTTIKLSEGSNDFISDKTCTTTHAELAALLKIKKLKSCPKYIDLVVINLKKNGDLGNSKPCSHCIYILSISKVKINNVYFNNDSNVVIKQKFSKLSNLYTSDFHNKHFMSKSLRFKCRDNVLYSNYCKSI